MGDLDEGTDVSIFSPCAVAAGGTALNLATAVVQQTRNVPLVIAAVGNDVFGRWLVTECERIGINVDQITYVDEKPTAIISVNHKPNGARLMIQSRDTANQGARIVAPMRLDEDTPSVPALLFISGYCFTQHGSSRMTAVRTLAEHARGHEIPILVDLVPHAFRSLVGDYRQVESWIGPVLGFVGELDTFREFDLAVDAAEDYLSTMRAVASVASEERYHVFVQQRLSISQYAQVAFIPGRGMLETVLELTGRRFRAIGDQLLVHALVRAELLNPSNDHSLGTAVVSRWL